MVKTKRTKSIYGLDLNFLTALLIIRNDSNTFALSSLSINGSHVQSNPKHTLTLI